MSSESQPLQRDSARNGPALSRTARRGARFKPALALLAALPLSGCLGILDPAGPVGAAQRVMLLNASAIMVFVVLIPVIGMVIGFAWRYRANGGTGTYRPTWAYSGAVELVVWAIPLLIIFFLGGIAWIGSHDLDPPKPLDSGREAMEVQVVALDWKWLFIYPTLNAASVNELVVPVGQPIRFRITSATVMNAFHVPQLGSMIYGMNGMETKLHLMADRPGTFEGLSAHYSGDGFSDMRFHVRALPTAEFNDWIGQARATGEALDTASYAKLAEESQDVKPYTYRSVQSGLFNSIVLQTAPDAPGPSKGEPSADVSPRPEG